MSGYVNVHIDSLHFCTTAWENDMLNLCVCSRHYAQHMCHCREVQQIPSSQQKDSIKVCLKCPGKDV